MGIGCRVLYQHYSKRGQCKTQKGELVGGYEKACGLVEMSDRSLKFDSVRRKKRKEVGVETTADKKVRGGRATGGEQFGLVAAARLQWLGK